MADTDPGDRTEHKSLYKTAVEQSPDGIFALTNDLELALVNRRIESLAGVEREELVGSHASVFREIGLVDGANYDRAIAACRTVLDGDADSEQFEIQLTPQSEPITAEYRVERVSREEENALLIGVLRDITPRIEQQKQIKRQRNELKTVSQIQSLLHNIMKSLPSSTTRAEINQVVCNQLIQSSFYDAAWMGYKGPQEEGVRGIYTAGVEPGLQEFITTREMGRDGASILSEAFDTEHIQVISSPATDPRLPDQFRDQLVRYGYESAILVPLTIDHMSFGVLMAATHRKNAFISRERMAFEALGGVVEFAVNAVENVQLLQGAKMVELRFQIQTGAIAADISDTFDCECYLNGISPAPNDNLRCFVSVEDAPTDEVAVFAEQQAAVRSVEVIDEWESGGTFEIVLGTSPLQPLIDSGVYIEGASASDGTAHISVRIGADRDPVEILDRVESVYPEIELVSKQLVEDTRHPVFELSGWVGEHLTSKQRQALEEAYFRGYFEWPRENTAEEIAEALGVSSATFHAHHRKATQKLLSAVFEKSTEREM
ncbi:bacterio-opsin activator domain-containing protein [Halorubrum sp. BV1]|uniref:bacterio-opsin activator domain-containing protein n=1 Tax=Halorubrum sp. BV1 TaxID=1498500 RepID=UPI0009B5AD7C|nr:bacterio-opsin activator domain-containing protein [Halorubrum sp. BV1]